MDLTSISLAVAALGVLILIIISDWRTRSARSFGLLAVSLMLMALFTRTTLPFPLGLALSVVPLIPIAFNPSWLMPLAKPDRAMVTRISAIERSLVQASDDFRRGRIDGRK